MRKLEIEFYLYLQNFIVSQSAVKVDTFVCQKLDDMFGLFCRHSITANACVSDVAGFWNANLSHVEELS